ncbi:hypothetical protein VTN49DRAFT_7397 [Thermomyces lanuginosus]|uniref:uncharacterized protein n=1 Tax=Thermomyces lanuginosus TaxID=5541 RepID=UPI003744822A
MLPLQLAIATSYPPRNGAPRDPRFWVGVSDLSDPIRSDCHLSFREEQNKLSVPLFSNCGRYISIEDTTN